MISVILPSYLGHYPGAATNRPAKLHRAIKSYLLQDHGELIIVADGCDDTMDIARQYPVRSFKIDKQITFSGYCRQYGIQQAKYDWICYLDSDDEFKEGHLKNITDNITPDIDWLYYDDIVNGQYRNNIVQYSRIGTTSIAHKKSLDAIWPDHYDHDWKFIQQLQKYPHKKIENCGYILHHIPNRMDN